MKLLQKITSLAMTAAIVMGLGANLMAAPKSVKIDAQHFPDSGFRTYVSKNYDKDHNGTLSVNEVYGALYMTIGEKDNVTSLQGIKYLGFIKELNISDTILTDKELDLFSHVNLIKIYLTNVSGVKTLIPSYMTTELYVSFCQDISSIDFEDTDYMTKLYLVNNNKLKGNIDISVSPYLRELFILDNHLNKADYNIINVYVNKKANIKLKELQIQGSMIRR